jgi:hypothetical protein
MPTYPQTITNPGAESGITSWTGDSGFASSTSEAHSGSKGFSIDNGEFYQTLTIDAARYNAIDHGQVSASFKGWHKYSTALSTSGSGRLELAYYSSENALLGTSTGSFSSTSAWTQLTLTTTIVPSGTRYIVIRTENTVTAGSATNWWDDFTLDLIDSEIDNLAVSARDQQTVVYATSQQPADSILTQQTAILTVNAAETSNGEYEVYGQQFVGYALVRDNGDRRKLKAWTFTQDDHDFYVVQLGDYTLVFDKLTSQWARWQSPSYNYWRGDDGCGWEGFNVCCDPLTGKIWKIDPEGRLDTDGATITPITSQVTGILTERFRKHIPCYMAELAVSEGLPPTGVDAGEAYFQLRTSSDHGGTWTDHGQVLSLDSGEDITVRWYGLGVMKAPGTVFEITDTGYARRINGFNIELGGGDGK